MGKVPSYPGNKKHRFKCLVRKCSLCLLLLLLCSSEAAGASHNYYVGAASRFPCDLSDSVLAPSAPSLIVINQFLQHHRR